MCCEPIPARPEDTVGNCEDCGSPIDKRGETTDKGCVYSPTICKTCGDCPCDWSC